LTRVAAIQMVTCADVARNLTAAERLLGEARERGAVVASLPENFAFMGHDEADKLAVAEDDTGGPIQSHVSGLARTLGLWIVAGTIPLRVPGETRVAAACLVYDAAGRRVARYDKIHLFDVAIPVATSATRSPPRCGPAGMRCACPRRPARSGSPSATTCAFRALPPAARPRGRVVLPAVGLHRAHRPRALGDAAARTSHREPLPRVAPAQSGFHDNGRETHGDSMIVDCWGRVLARLPRGSGVVVADIDLVRQRELRQNFPTLDHRRPRREPHPDRHSARPVRPAVTARGGARDGRPARAGPRRAARAGRLDEDRVARILGDVMGHAVDYADVYFQLVREESWSLEDGIVKDGTHSIDHGVGVRALAGEKAGFAIPTKWCSRPCSRPRTRHAPSRARAARVARRLAVAGAARPVLPLDPVESLGDAEKVALLESVDREARALDSRITQVMASLAASHDTILVLASDGTLAADVRPLVRLNVSVIIEHEGRREQGYAGGGGRFGYGEFLASDRWRELVREAVRTARVNLEAVPAPAGTMTVVLGAGWPGVLLHEAVGHGLEGDFNRKGTSAFSGRIGQRVAAPGVTIVDDGTLAARRGSLNVDDEGTPTQCTTLIEDGVLRGYLQDKLNARLMGVAPTGNGRRESFAHLTMRA